LVIRKANGLQDVPSLDILHAASILNAQKDLHCWSDLIKEASHDREDMEVP